MADRVISWNTIRLTGHLRLEHLQEVPRDGLALAILIRGEIELVGVLQQRLQPLDDVALVRVDLVLGLEVGVDVDRQALRRAGRGRARPRPRRRSRRRGTALIVLALAGDSTMTRGRDAEGGDTAAGYERHQRACQAIRRDAPAPDGSRVGSPAMANLLRLIVDLAEDDGARAEFLTDPEPRSTEFDDLCSEDVAAALDVARQQVEPDVCPSGSPTALATGPGRGESAREAAAPGARHALRGASTTTGASDRRRRARGRPTVRRGRSVPSTSGPWTAAVPARTTSTRARHRRSPRFPTHPAGSSSACSSSCRCPTACPMQASNPAPRRPIVAVHRDPELSYEIEVSGDDGGRRFLGVVPTSAVAQRKF